MKARTDEHRPRTVTELLDRHRIMDRVRFSYHRKPKPHVHGWVQRFLDRVLRRDTIQRQKARRRIRSKLAYESRRANR